MEQADLSGGKEMWRDQQEAEEAGDEITSDVIDDDKSVETLSPETATMACTAQVPPLGELLQVGARFLMELGQALAPQPVVAKNGATSGDAPHKTNPLAALVGVDEATGKRCLKIPLPEPEVMTSIVSGLTQLLAGFMAGRK